MKIENHKQVLIVGRIANSNAETLRFPIHVARNVISVLCKIIFEMISNKNQNHESLTDLKS